MADDPNSPGSGVTSSTFTSQVPAGSPNTFTRVQYVQAVLKQGGWPDTPDNEQFLLNLAQREHAASDTKDPSAAFNLFDSEKPEPNSTFFNHTSSGAGVQNYSNFQEGVVAAVATLKQGYYKNIQAGLAAGNAATQDAAGKFTTDLHTWSGGGYSTVSDANGVDAPISGTGLSDQGSGVAGVDGSTGETTGPAGLTGDLDGFLQSQAPQLAKSLNADADVKSLLQQWGAGTISDSEFADGIQKTKWYTTTPDAQRTQLILSATNPATAAAKLNTQVSQVVTQAKQLGIPITTAQAQQLATEGINEGWSADQATQALAKLGNYGPNATYTGEAATAQAQLQQWYNEYAVPSSPAKINQQLQGVLGGTQNLSDLQAQIAQQAKTLYSTNPQLVQAIDSGQTVAQVADPYLTRYTTLTGQEATGADLTTPMFAKILTPPVDPSTGKSTGQMISLDQWDKTVRNDPQYNYDSSTNAIQSATALAAGLKQTLGYQA